MAGVSANSTSVHLLQTSKANWNLILVSRILGANTDSYLGAAQLP